MPAASGIVCGMGLVVTKNIVGCTTLQYGPHGNDGIETNKMMDIETKPHNIYLTVCDLGIFEDLSARKGLLVFKINFNYIYS